MSVLQTAAKHDLNVEAYYNDSKLNEIIVNAERIKNYYSPLGGVEKSQVITGNTETLDYAYNSSGLANQRSVVGKSRDVVDRLTS